MSEPVKLNLQQKKYIEQHKGSADFIEYSKKISTLVGSDIKIIFDWDSVAQGLVTDSWGNMFLNNGNNIKEWFLINFEEGLKITCGDKLGKEAFVESIKEVVFKHGNEPHLSIKNGVLTFIGNLHGNGSPGKDTVADFFKENL